MYTALFLYIKHIQAELCGEFILELPSANLPSVTAKLKERESKRQVRKLLDCLSATATH